MSTQDDKVQSLQPQIKHLISNFLMKKEIYGKKKTIVQTDTSGAVVLDKILFHSTYQC